MSLTSSRRDTRSASRTGQVRYERAIWGAALIALGLSVLALVVYALQGPRLRSASIDVVRSVAYPEAVLRLESDRPLAEISPDQVTVEPATPVQLTIQGYVAAVVFSEALRYGTEYEVRIEGVRGQGASPQGDWVHRFSTPEAQLAYLDRGSGAEPDRVMSVGMTGEPPREIYAAQSIDVFIPIGSSVVVFSREGDSTVVTLAEPVSNRTERLALPPNTEVDQVFSPATGTRVLFTLSSTDGSNRFDRTLHLIDTVGQRTPRALTGLDGRELRVTKAAVVPGTDRVVAWVDDVQVVSIDLASGLVLPVTEEAAEFWGVSSLGDDAILVDLAGTVAIDVSTLEETRLIPGQLAGRDVFEGQTHLLADGSRLQTVAVGNPSGTDFTSLVVRDDGSGALDVIYRTPGDLGSIGRFVVSPADQYVAIETTPNRQNSLSDQRFLEPRAESVSTVVVDIDTGQVVRSVEGMWPVWAR